MAALANEVSRTWQTASLEAIMQLYISDNNGALISDNNHAY